MRAVIETVFDIFYLVTVLTVGIRMIRGSKAGTQFRLFGLMAVVLGAGDSFHLVPRALALCTTGLENYAVPLGLGKWITSVTMTVFYVLLYYVWRKRYQIEGQKNVTAAVYALSAVRVVLCMMPQNQWLTNHTPLAWGILRNVPFALLGLLIIVLFYRSAKQNNDKAFRWMWLTIVLTMLLTALVGVTLERIAYRPLRDAPRISALISAIAVSFFIESLSVVVFSGLPRPVYQPEWLMTPINFGQLKLLPITLVVPVVSFVLVLGLLWIIHRTKPGLAMRAISKDIETTRLLGVRGDRIIALAFGLGSALAAASGIMWALRYPQINPYMGIFPGFKAFIAAVLGGIGSIQGAMIGGLLLGFIEIMTVAFMPSLSGYRDAFAFVVLVLVLLVRPTGLFGQRSEEKI